MATHCSILAWEIPDRAAWQATGHGVTKESDMTSQLNNSNTFFLAIVFSEKLFCPHSSFSSADLFAGVLAWLPFLRGHSLAESL